MLIDRVVLPDVVQLFFSDDDLVQQLQNQECPINVHRKNTKEQRRQKERKGRSDAVGGNVANDAVETFQWIPIKSSEEPRGREDQEEAGRQTIAELIRLSVLHPTVCRHLGCLQEDVVEVVAEQHEDADVVSSRKRENTVVSTFIPTN